MWDAFSLNFQSCLRPKKENGKGQQQSFLPEKETFSYDRTVATQSLSYDSSGMSYEEMPMKTPNGSYFPFASLLGYNSSTVLSEDDDDEVSRTRRGEVQSNQVLCTHALLRTRGIKYQYSYSDSDWTDGYTEVAGEDQSNNRSENATQGSCMPTSPSNTNNSFVNQTKSNDSSHSNLIWIPNRSEMVEVVKSNQEGCAALHRAMSINLVSKTSY